MRCAGCSQPVWSGPTDLVCQFALRGFTQAAGQQLMPCHVAYHSRCLRAGAPFTCRRRDRSGLTWPKIRFWPIFICECCTVRAVVGRELGATGDLDLLRYERMRLLDLANSWADNTFKGYGGGIKFLTQFEQQHRGMRILSCPSLERPPVHGSIPLAWSELAYSLRPANDPTKGSVVFGTVRAVRSAARWHHVVASIVCQAGQQKYLGNKQLSLERTLVSEDAGFAQFTKGLQGRIGSDSRPSFALLDRHVRAMDAHFERQYLEAGNRQDRQYWASAGLANMFLWLGWLRSRELFDLRWCDIEVIDPEDGPSRDLPPGVGAIILSLKEQTKTNQSSTADVVIAFVTSSQYQPGLWYHRLRTNRLGPGDPAYNQGFLFETRTGRQWDSHFYRHQFVYPMLHRLQEEGDPYLTPFTGGLKGTLEQVFKGLHMYRRGAHNHVDIVRDRLTQRRKATPKERYEHARWNYKRAGERIDVQYRQWSLYDRLKITIFCH